MEKLSKTIEKLESNLQILPPHYTLRNINSFFRAWETGFEEAEDVELTRIRDELFSIWRARRAIKEVKIWKA